ncbi:MAG: hypothetical protein EPN26_03445 [Rhodospirillales bacterium]|nr:MAG: hypothetical protein EPN26_03445 [Rhodospirillales bacterium]
MNDAPLPEDVCKMGWKRFLAAHEVLNGGQLPPDQIEQLRRLFSTFDDAYVERLAIGGAELPHAIPEQPQGTGLPPLPPNPAGPAASLLQFAVACIVFWLLLSSSIENGDWADLAVAVPAFAVVILMILWRAGLLAGPILRFNAWRSTPRIKRGQRLHPDGKD